MKDFTINFACENRVCACVMVSYIPCTMWPFSSFQFLLPFCVVLFLPVLSFPSSELTITNIRRNVRVCEIITFSSISPLFSSIYNLNSISPLLTISCLLTLLLGSQEKSETAFNVSSLIH